MQHRVYFVCVSSQAFVFSFVILGPLGGCFSDSDDNDSDANKVRTYKVIRSKEMKTANILSPSIVLVGHLLCAVFV